VKCSRLLGFTDGLSNNVSNIIRRIMDNKILLLYVL
jgi:hypothetical protein